MGFLILNHLHNEASPTQVPLYLVEDIFAYLKLKIVSCIVF